MGRLSALVFAFGHLAPLQRNIEQLLLQEAISRRFGTLLACSGLGAILFTLRHHIAPRYVR